MGFFDKFINSLNYLMKGTKDEKIKSIKFLAKIFIGWIVGMGLAVTILANLFDKEIYKMSSLFLGFIIAAIPVMIMEEKESVKGKYQNIIWAIIGAVAVILLSSLKMGSNLDLTHLNIGMLIYIFIAGMLAISAMVLPGISGSTILLSFGLYIPVINGVKDFLHFDFSSFALLFTLGTGILFGVATVLRLIKKLLDNHRSAIVYAIIGMMIGSLYAIVIGPTTLKVPQAAMTLKTFSIIFFIIGVVIVLAFQQVKNLPFYKKELAKDE
jgi:putative membrane protein